MNLIFQTSARMQAPGNKVRKRISTFQYSKNEKKVKRVNADGWLLTAQSGRYSEKLDGTQQEACEQMIPVDERGSVRMLRALEKSCFYGAWIKDESTCAGGPGNAVRSAQIDEILFFLRCPGSHFVKMFIIHVWNFPTGFDIIEWVEHNDLLLG